MDWMMLSGNVPSHALLSLGVMCGDQYYLDDNCLQYLEEMLDKLADEDKSTRSFRRAFSFMNVVKKDLVPILIYAREEPAIFHTAIKVLVELTIPVECLVPVEAVSMTGSGLHMLHELQYLLYNAKEAFLDPRATKALIEEISSLAQIDRGELSDVECEQKHNILMLLRNILHTTDKSPSHSQAAASVYPQQQNRLLWNLFAQGLDQCILQMLQSSYSDRWAVTIVQLIALFYKDQHVETLQRLLSNWMDSNDSDSSEDNESNTSPPMPGSSHSTPMLTSDPTSDASSSSDGAAAAQQTRDKAKPLSSEHTIEKQVTSPSSGFGSEPSIDSSSGKATSEEEPSKSTLTRPAPDVMSATTSSEDTSHSRPKRASKGCQAKTVHTSVQNIHQHILAVPDKGTRRKKKLYKRSRSYNQHIKITAKLSHTPTDDEIAEMLREFTVDLLLQGYDQLVGQIHKQLLKDPTLPMDKSHFLWLITYFLRFASQLELDLKHIGRVLSLDLVSYLCLEGLLMSEQVELTYQQGCSGEVLKPHLRRLHLAVTALREVFQALETYSRLMLSDEDMENLKKLRLGLADMVDLRQLFLLLIRHYNPILQNRRYLRDAITTNHVLLVTLERATQLPTYNGKFSLVGHLKQFCTASLVRQYGLALEDFQTNGPFVNDCILTLLHHVGGDLGQPELLCQPLVLRAFSAIWEDEFELCDDWVDLIEFTMQRFLRSVAESSSSALVHGRISAGGSEEWSATMPVFGASDRCATDSSLLRQENRELDSMVRLENLKRQVVESGFEWALQWIQRVLMEVCTARLLILEGREFAHPLACLTQKMGIGMPLVAWTEDQAQALRFEPFALLLYHLGIVPALGGGIYPRIPYHWDANTLYSLAKLLGPLPEDALLFSETLVQEITIPMLPLSPAMEIPDSHLMPPFAGPGPSTSMSLGPHTWLHWVEASGSLVRSAERAASMSSGPSQRGTRPVDSASTTSSLEVHKTESRVSSDSEMAEEDEEEELNKQLDRDGDI